MAAVVSCPGFEEVNLRASARFMRLGQKTICRWPVGGKVCDRAFGLSRVITTTPKTGTDCFVIRRIHRL